MEGIHGGCGLGEYVSAEVGSLAAITSRNVSNDRSGSAGVTIFGHVFFCLQISSKHNNYWILTSFSLSVIMCDTCYMVCFSD